VISTKMKDINLKILKVNKKKHKKRNNKEK